MNFVFSDIRQENKKSYFLEEIRSINPKWPNIIVRNDIHLILCCGKSVNFKVITQLLIVIYINENGWKYSDNHFFCKPRHSSTEEEETIICE